MARYGLLVSFDRRTTFWSYLLLATRAAIGFATVLCSWRKCYNAAHDALGNHNDVRSVREQMGLYTSHHLLARLDLLSRPFMAFVRLYCRLRVDGLEHIPEASAFILAANHSSHADTAVIFAALPRPMRKRVVAAAAQDYFFDNGLRQFVSRVLFNTIPVPRSAFAGSDPLRHVIRALREGYGVLLFPEGTRSQNGELGPFRSGIGRLAGEFPDVPIIPVWLEGTGRVLPKKASVPLPVSVSVHFGAPVVHSPAQLADKISWRTVANEVREALLDLSKIH
jgi:1-acyl-sn-glycerol-3-phosphate acyltransferase